MWSCMYTHQKRKKKKIWSDGILSLKYDPISNTNGGIVCLREAKTGTLQSGEVIDSRSLNRNEIDKIISLELFDLEFDGYLVTIENEISDQSKKADLKSSPNLSRGSLLSNTSVDKIKSSFLAPKLNLSKFKVPRSIATSQLPTVTMAIDGNISPPLLQNEKEKRNVSSGIHYDINDDELDDIWSSDIVSIDSKNQADKHPLVDKHDEREDPYSYSCDNCPSKNILVRSSCEFKGNDEHEMEFRKYYATVDENECFVSNEELNEIENNSTLSISECPFDPVGVSIEWGLPVGIELIERKRTLNTDYDSPSKKIRFNENNNLFDIQKLPNNDSDSCVDSRNLSIWES